MISDLIASFGQPLPSCPNCKSRMVMSCREAYSLEPLVFTFECRSCRFVMQRVKERLISDPLL
jgi:hypothetical protein